MSMSRRRVVITGLGVASSIGIGWEEFWQSLCEQKVGIRPLDSYDVSKFACRVGCAVGPYRISKHLPRSYRKAAKLMGRDIELAVVAADYAVRDSGLITKAIDPDNPQVDPARLGTNLGAGLMDLDLDEIGPATRASLGDDGHFGYKLWGERGMEQLTPLWLLKFLPNMLACHISIIHDAQGVSNTILTGEISTHQALGEAYHTVAEGVVDVSIAGGAKSKLEPLGFLRMELLGRLNTSSNENPSQACMPFSTGRAGSVPAESGAVFILEELGHAQARGAKIYAEIGGVAATHQGKNTHQLQPSVEGLARAIRQALGVAGVGAEDVDLVIPHGVGGVEEDLAEARGIRMGLGEEKGTSVPVLPIQGAVGNSDAGVGGPAIASATLAISEDIIPAASNCPEPCPQCGLNISQANKADAGVDVVLALGHTIGGQSAALVLKRYVG